MQTETKSPETVQLRAYQIWEAEGRPHGRDQAHWFQAERELDAKTPIISEPAAVAPAAKTAPKTRRRSSANGSSTSRKRKASEARA